jgi:hypothetical protein
VLVLASDGLWDVVTPAEAAAFVMERLRPADPSAAAAAALAAAAGLGVNVPSGQGKRGLRGGGKSCALDDSQLSLLSCCCCRRRRRRYPFARYPFTIAPQRLLLMMPRVWCFWNLHVSV